MPQPKHRCRSCLFTKINPEKLKLTLRKSHAKSCSPFSPLLLLLLLKNHHLSSPRSRAAIFVFIFLFRSLSRSINYEVMSTRHVDISSTSPSPLSQTQLFVFRKVSISEWFFLFFLSFSSLFLSLSVKLLSKSTLKKSLF